MSIPANKINKPNRHPFRAAWAFVRNWARKLLHARSDAHQIAFGFAIGAFIGVFPTFGLGFIAIAAIAVVVRFNVPAAFIGTAIANPFLGPFWMYVSYKVGKAVTAVMPVDVSFLKKSGFLSRLLDNGVDYLIGNTIVSAIAAVVGYVLVLIGVNYARDRMAARRQYHQERMRQHEQEQGDHRA